MSAPKMTRKQALLKVWGLTLSYLETRKCYCAQEKAGEACIYCQGAEALRILHPDLAHHVPRLEPAPGRLVLAKAEGRAE